MLEFVTIDVSTSETKAMGCKKYKTIPRIGEWVEIEIAGIAHMFIVVMVAHSSTGHGSDIFVKHLAEAPKAIHTLHKVVID